MEPDESEGPEEIRPRTEKAKGRDWARWKRGQRPPRIAGIKSTKPEGRKVRERVVVQALVNHFRQGNSSRKRRRNVPS